MVDMTKRGSVATTGEICELLKVAKTKKQRLQLLKEYSNHLGLKTILRLQFDKRFKLALPPGTPEGLKVNNTPPGLGEVTINNSVNKFYLFVAGASKINQTKREALFLGLLQSLDKQEAKLLIDIKDKKLDIGVTRALVDEAFPNLIPSDNTETQNGSKREKEVGDDSSL